MDHGQHNTLLICTFDPDYELSSVLQEAKRKVEKIEEKKQPVITKQKSPMQAISTEARQYIEIHLKTHKSYMRLIMLIVTNNKGSKSHFHCHLKQRSSRSTEYSCKKLTVTQVTVALVWFDMGQ